MRNPKLLLIIGLTFVSLFCVQMGQAAVRVWDGLGPNDNWTTPGNWVGGLTPNPADDVFFSSTAPRDCFIDASRTVNNFTVPAGSTITITLSSTPVITLTINGNLHMSSGTLDANESRIDIGGDWHFTHESFFIPTLSTVTFISASSKTLSGSSTFYNLRAMTFGSTLYFQADSTTTIQNRVDFQDVILKSTSTGSHWWLDYQASSQTQTLLNVDVEDSDASLGTTMYADIDSFDRGNNFNWDFAGSTSPVFYWDNDSGDGLWSTALNWNQDSVPGANAEIFFDGGVSNSSSSANIDITISSLNFVSGYSHTLSISSHVVIKSPLTLTAGVTVQMTGGHLEIDGQGAADALIINGILEWPPFPTANSTITVTGIIQVNSGGEFFMGTATSPIPSNINAYLILDSSNTAGSAGLIVNNGGIFEVAGSSPSYFADTSAMINATDTSFQVGVATEIAGWKIGDEIIIGKTRANGTDETERKTITSISFPNIFVNPAFVYPHTSPALVANITRNVKIYSANPTFPSYIRNLAQSMNDFLIRDAEFINLGRNSAGQEGIIFDGANVKGDIDGISVHDGYRGLFINGGSSITITDNVFYSNSDHGIYLLNGGSHTLTENVSMSNNVGLKMTNTNNNKIDSLDTYSNVATGLDMSNSSNNYIFDSEFIGNTAQGVVMTNSFHNRFNTSVFNFNNNHGIHFSAAQYNMVSFSEIRGNSMSGIMIQNSSNTYVNNNDIFLNNTGVTASLSDLSALEGNKIYNNTLHGVELINAHLNHIFFNEIYGNSSDGINLSNSNNTTMAANSIYSNVQDGIDTQSSFLTRVYNSRIGFNNTLTSLGNGPTEIRFANTSNTMELFDTRVNDAMGPDINPTNLMGSNYLISKKHNQILGETRLYGDYTVTNSTMSLEYSFQTYSSTATPPIRYVGNGHTAFVNSTDNLNAETQVISIEFNGGQWHVNGSSTGINMIAPFGPAGTLSNTPVPSGTPQFYLSFNPGGSPQEGDRITFLLVEGAHDQTTQKRLLFGPADPGFNNGRSRLTIGTNGDFKAIGVLANPTFIDWISPSSTYYSIVSSGNFTLSYATVTHLDLDGIHFKGFNSIQLGTVTFDHSMGGVNNTYLMADSLNSQTTFFNVVFDDSDLTNPFNVRVVGSDASLDWNFKNFGGVRGGEAFDDEPGADVVKWAGVSQPLTQLFPFWTGVDSTTVSAQWNSIGSNSYEARLSSQATFTTFQTSNTSLNNVTFYGLLTDTTYYLRVKISTESGFLLPQNEISTQTDAGAGATLLSPTFVHVGSTTIDVDWTGNSTSSYTIVLSTRSDFLTYTTSVTISSNAYDFTGLNPNTAYWFEMKLTTEADTSFASNMRSTTTLAPVGATVLTPYFSAVGLDFIDTDWNHIPTSNFIAALSTEANFASTVSSGLVTSNFKDYFSLQQDTTYYFKVKISTETDASYSVAIQTITHSSSSAGNYALNFNGIDNQVVILPNNVAFDMGVGNYTLEFWFRRNSNNALIQHIVSKDNPAFDRGWGIVLQAAGEIRYEPFGVGGGLTSSSRIIDTAWHHFALSRDASGNTVMYIDGANEASGVTNIPLVTGAPLKFGTRDNGLDDFHGVLDEVRFWTSIRSQTDIQTFKNIRIMGNEAGLLSYWDFDDGSGQLLTDVSPAALDGTLGLTVAALPDDPTWVIDHIPGFGASNDTTAPTVLIGHPLDSSSQTVTTLDFLTGTAQDNGFIDHVDFRLSRASDGYFWRFNNGLYNGTGNWAPGSIWNEAQGAENWVIHGIDIFWATGTYTLNVRAEDSNFNVNFDTVNFTVETATETIPPTVGIQYPVHLSTYTKNQLTLLSGTAQDETSLFRVGIRIIRHMDNKEWDGFGNFWTSTVPFMNDANFDSVSGLANWDFNIIQNAWDQGGDYTFIAAAQDAAGNVTPTTVTFHVEVSTQAGSDSVPPTVVITHPASGTIHAPIALNNLYGTASDNIDVLEVSVKIEDLITGYWNGADFHSPQEFWHFLPFAPNSFVSWNFGGVFESAWTDGHQYRMVARAKDGNQNLSYTTSYFTVNSSSSSDTIPPTINIVRPTDGGSFTPDTIEFEGTAGDNDFLDKVEISLKKIGSPSLYYDGVSFVSGTEIFLLTNGVFNWDYHIPPPAFSNASYVMKARSIDGANNVSTQTINFSITGATTSSDVTAPTLAVTNPTSGATYTSSTIQGLSILQGTANDDVEVVEVVISLKDDNNKYWDENQWSEDNEFWIFYLNCGKRMGILHAIRRLEKWNFHNESPRQRFVQ